MRKWALTIILVALAGVATWLSRWPPHVWRAAVTNRETIGLVTDLMSWLLWVAAASSALHKVWSARRPPPGKQQAHITAIPDGRAGRDQIAADGDVQTGGQRIEGPVAGDAAGEEITHGDKVGRDKIVMIQQAAAAATPAPLHQLPPPPGDFTGREGELAELRQALAEGGVTISGMTGMGGVGKTALALKLADELKDRYPDAQFCLDLLGTSDQPTTPAQAMTRVIQSFHPEAKLPESEAELRPLYCSVLEGKRALLLMDNAADANQVRPLIPPASCVLLVTSRQHFTLPGLCSKNLDVLPPGDARELLLKIEPRIRDLAGEIAELCGYLPLALCAAGSVLAVMADLDPAEYARALRDERQRLERIGGEGVPIGVEASFGLSYERLPDDTAAVFRKLAVFPGSFDVAAEEVVCEDTHHRRLSELVRRSLVQWDDISKRYRLHDLVRLFAESRLGEDERQATQQRHAEHYLETLVAAGSLFRAGGDALLRGLALFALEIGNLRAGQAWSAAHFDEDRRVARICSGYYSDLGAAYMLNQRLPPRERIAWLEGALAASRNLADQGAESTHLGNLGIAYLDFGDCDRALHSHEAQLALARETGNRRNEGNALGNIGCVCARRGEFRKAISFHEQHLTIAREIRDWVGEANELFNIGLAHWNLKDPALAVRFYTEALIIDREKCYAPGMAADLWNMSLALDELGQRDKAVANAEAALAIHEQIEHPAAEKVRRQLAEWRRAK